MRRDHLYIDDLWCRLSHRLTKLEDIEEPENSLKDISGHWQPFLDIMFELVVAMKVPHKAKQYEQTYFRSMFLPKDEKIPVDGVTYEITKAASRDSWNSKEKVLEMMAMFKSVDDLSDENFMDEKKKLINKLKDFDKDYIRHMKKTHPEISEIIIEPAIGPLMNLLESNYNFHKLEELIKKKLDIPDFRFHALEDRFCEHLEIICTVLKEHGNLKDTFAIKRMLNLLKIDGWEDKIPMAYYLTPLRNAIKAMRDELLIMKKKGQNRCKYYIEENEPMHSLVIDMVKKDVTAQWLMGNSLKIDQICFLYEVITIVYRSPLKDKLVNKEIDIIDKVIPMLATFEALLRIKNIVTLQVEEKLKEKRSGLTDGETAPAEEEIKTDPEEESKGESEADIDKYGRKWIWETYISENRKPDWMEAAEMLRHINDHVIQDIRDYILIQGFNPKIQKDRKVIAEKVEALLTASEKATTKEGKEEIEVIKKKRSFELQLRPPFVWNFFETRLDKEEKLKLQSKFDTKEAEPTEEESTEDKPYLINPNADPEA